MRAGPWLRRREGTALPRLHQGQAWGRVTDVVSGKQ